MTAALPTPARDATDLTARLVELAFLARAVDAELERLALAGKLRGFRPAHRAVWPMVATGLALGPEDQLFGTSRDWPAALGRGVSAATLMRQMFAKDGDPSLGRSLPGGLHDAVRKIILSDGSAAAHILHAVGFGVAAQLRRGPGVAVALFGAGAFASGDVHAAFSLAPLRAARVVFVVRGPRGDEPGFDAAAEAWGLRLVPVDGDHGAAVFEAVSRARVRALAGEGPTLIDARHQDSPRVPEDLLVLQRAGRLSSEAERATEAEIRATVWAARKSAEAASAPGPDTLFAHRLAADGDDDDPVDPHDPVGEDPT